MTQSITTWFQHWTIATRDLSIVTSPPDTERFKAVKTILTSAFELSEYERETALFNLPGLCDSKPSELMDAMLALLGTHKPCFIFKHVFLHSNYRIMFELH